MRSGEVRSSFQTRVGECYNGRRRTRIDDIDFDSVLNSAGIGVLRCAELQSGGGILRYRLPSRSRPHGGKARAGCFLPHLENSAHTTKITASEGGDGTARRD